MRDIACEQHAPIISAVECAFLRPREDLRRVGRALPGVWNQQLVQDPLADSHCSRAHTFPWEETHVLIGSSYNEDLIAGCQSQNTKINYIKVVSGPSLNLRENLTLKFKHGIATTKTSFWELPTPAVGTLLVSHSDSTIASFVYLIVFIFYPLKFQLV